MKFMLVLLSFLFLAGCTGSVSTNPLKDAGCAVEQSITGAFGQVIVDQCAGTDAKACSGALLSALGNVNVCQTSAKAQAQAKDVQSKGVIAGVVCPIAYSAVTGLVTGLVPKECGCTKNLDAGALGSALIAACSALPF